ncbi:PGF-CTERM sorting domain-containing protein [Halobacteria archaeon AArc-m2/3/4]|uniref:PGF-CTERM sorting domain-containing protein n=1 Tax=Natronoglomus mannanivorans TaxID=2979990 RepID=A0AAP2YWT8_9EURY|nr:PGF-CTERM sorting domain-containing protein [Halobacteria archaeon AArc-xg1-1]MCU4973698.1 PGF-CTERM sorting domain-containing protein [Halobacteria archaeon AArc-m2/3/4]
MKRELVLVAAALAVVAVGVLGALVLPGAVADPAESDTESAVEHPGDVSIAEVTIAADEVTGASATLTVDTYLTHRGNPVENVTVVHRATDTNTGLVEDTRELEAPVLEDETERLVRGDVTVPRESDYRIETIVYEGGTRTVSTDRRVEGVEHLTPAYADTSVEFHRFGTDLPAVSYAVDSTDDDADRVTLDVSTSLTNTGDDVEDELRLEVTARQDTSNVVADSATVDVGTVEPGSTTTPSVDLTVPQGYDYSLDAILWTDETIVATSRAPANLGPGNLTIDTSDTAGGLEVSDFDGTTSESGPTSRGGTDYDDAEDGDDGQPGFGAVAAVGSLLAIGVIARRRRETNT